MIGALVATISLLLTQALVNAGQVALTLPVTGATVTTPIRLTSTAHGIALGRVAHGIVAGVGGTFEANGLWQLTPVDANTLSLSSFDPQGNPVQSVGLNPYTTGGTISIAFPDLRILLGRRWIAAASAVASPRIVFVPVQGRAWNFEPYGGVGSPATVPPSRGSAEQQAEKLEPQLATEFLTFEVHVTGAASPPSPDFGDFDATQVIVHALYATLFEAIGPARAQVLREAWPSQMEDAGTQTQRGQKWVGVLELQVPVHTTPLSFVPPGVTLTETIIPQGGGSNDATVLVIT